MAKNNFLQRVLDSVERNGNKLPDPAILFLVLMLVIWVVSALLSPIEFTEINPRTQEPIEVVNLLTGAKLAEFLANMVSVFINFAPLGVVLVAMLGVGVAEHSGYINVALKKLLGVTPRSLLTPMLILVAIVSHTAVDAGYVLVIPLGGVIFYAAGRHPWPASRPPSRGYPAGSAPTSCPHPWIRSCKVSRRPPRTSWIRASRSTR